MNLKKLQYDLKRIGIVGLFRRIFLKQDTYELAFNRYYCKLGKDQYENELAEWYHIRTGRPKESIWNPVTFNDKINYLKMHDFSDIKTICSDKYAVRKYISDTIGQEYLIPLLGCWENFADIDFSKLPDRFVLKSNTGSGRIKLVDNKKMERCYISELKKTVDFWQNVPFGYDGMEIQYLPINRKILAEQFIGSDNGKPPKDYKFHCFHGMPLLVEYMYERVIGTHTVCESWMDINFNETNIKELGDTHVRVPEMDKLKPTGYDKMVKIAKLLSSPFKYVRVDLYNIEGKIYFGELTFTPARGNDKWEDSNTDYLLGNLLEVEKDESRSFEELQTFVKEQFID